MSDKRDRTHSNSSAAEGGMFHHASGQSEGTNTFAGGKAAHAEGSGTRALGNQSHAEGDSTTARGDASHAEGGGRRP
ncbi:hypothetical protein [Alicyclobacillus fastidiosus]|uniref:hypothetical protein n=1 Tax=Alicyclobacillus fastidiosus TaxID=392011 RepID=UPI0024E12A86|nr:hypothetical protein [Alicyclobacillus fastidiosus]